MSPLVRTGVVVLAALALLADARAEILPNTTVGSYAEALAEREIVLTHYRLARISAERRRVLDVLRQQAALRLEEQRAQARLARERLRDLATLSPRPSG